MVESYRDAERPLSAIRPAVLEDADEVLRLAHLMWEAMGLDSHHSPSPEWTNEYRSAFVAAVNDDESLGYRCYIFVVDDPDDEAKLIACGAAWVHRLLPAFWLANGRIGYLQWFSVDPEWRGNGIGESLLITGREWLIGQGCTRIHLHAAPAARSLYERHGFTEPHFTNMWWYPDSAPTS